MGTIRRFIAAALVAASLAPAPAVASAPSFDRETVDPSLTGAAFAVAADVLGGPAPELVVSAFGRIVNGQPIPNGSVGVYERDGDGWTRHEVVPSSEGILFPNEPAVSDVDGDGDADVVVPGGFFVCAFTGAPCGSITWWEQRDGGFVRHDVVPPGGALFYHRVVVADVNADGLSDLVTIGETLATAQAQVFLGTTGERRFAAVPIELGPFGGSLPTVEDVDGDGDLDIASAQFFMPGGSFAWLEQVSGPSPLAPAGTWVPHTISATEGGSIMLAKVPSLFGAGRDGWIGTNHTNPTSVPGSPEPGAFVLTPGADPRLPWSARRISEGIVCRANKGLGLQGAPGVFGWGDVDGDGDVDLAVSGDGDPRVFWLSQEADGTFSTVVVADEMGQAGGGAVIDTDGDGRNEILFTSYESGVVTLWHLRR